MTSNESTVENVAGPIRQHRRAVILYIGLTISQSACRYLDQQQKVSSCRIPSHDILQVDWLDYNKTGDGQLRFNDAVPPEPTP